MARFLEPRYLVFSIVASLIALVALQVTGEGEVLQANAPLERLEAKYDKEHHHGRAPIAITPKATDDGVRRR